MVNSKQKLKKLRRAQLDELYRTPSQLSRYDLPAGVWIKEVREALGMSATQMARNLQITPPTLKKLEASELKQTIALKSLQRLAGAMNCRLIYAIVPDTEFGSLEAILQKRARDLAIKIVSQVSHTMALEDQAVTPAESELQIQETANELIRNLDKRLWEVG